METIQRWLITYSTNIDSNKGSAYNPIVYRLNFK